jgi:hypothetical protein
MLLRLLLLLLLESLPLSAAWSSDWSTSRV